VTKSLLARKGNLRAWSKLDPYKPYLRERADAGVLNAVKLLPEVRRHGYPGGRSSANSCIRCGLLCRW
jgi:hypothetical protein